MDAAFYLYLEQLQVMMEGHLAFEITGGWET
jgi:hypothetical protein